MMDEETARRLFARPEVQARVKAVRERWERGEQGEPDAPDLLDQRLARLRREIDNGSVA